MTIRLLSIVLGASLFAAPSLAQDLRFFSVDEDPDGDGPIDLTYTPDGATLLVLHNQSEDLTFINAHSGVVESVVPVGADPYDVCVSPDGTFALTADRGSGTLTVIDLATRTVSATIPLTGSNPYQVEVTSDSASAVVGLAGVLNESWVSVINLATLTEELSFASATQATYFLFQLTQGQAQLDGLQDFYPRFDLTRDDTTLLLPSYGTVVAYEIATGNEIATFDYLWSVVAVKASEHADFAIAVGEHPGFNNYFSRLDLQTLTVTGTASVQPVFYGDALEFVGTDTIAVGTWNALHLIDVPTWTVTTTNNLPAWVFDFEVTHDQQHLVVTSSPDYDAQTTVTALIDVATQTVVASAPGGGRRLARSPIADEFAALELRIEERLHRFETQGAALERVGMQPTGAPIEGDAPLRAAVAEGTGYVLTANVVSRNVAMIDVESGTVECWIPTSGRPFEIETTPDGAFAVVLTSIGIELIDVAAGAVTDRVAIHGERLVLVGAGLAGPEAWVVSEVSGITGFEIVDASLRFITTEPLPGNIGHTLAASRSGMIAASISISTHNRFMFFYDTQARSVVGTANVYPYNLAIAPDGSAVYLRANDQLLEVQLDADELEVTRSMPLPGFFYITAGTTGQYLYVRKNGIQVIDLLDWEIVATLPSSGTMYAEGPYLFARSVDGWTRYRAFGPATTLIDFVAVPGGTRPPAISSRLGAIFEPQPGKEDRVITIDYTGDLDTYCGPAQPNSTGAPAQIGADGWLVAGATITLSARNVPANQVGLFLVSLEQAFIPFVSVSQGNLCLGGALGRFRGQVQNSGDDGMFEIVADTSALPQPGGPVRAAPGETWHFQAWYRDLNPGPTSNFSDGLSVTFR